MKPSTSETIKFFLGESVATEIEKQKTLKLIKEILDKSLTNYKWSVAGFFAASLLIILHLVVILLILELQ